MLGKEITLPCRLGNHDPHAIPFYVISCFRLPKRFTHELNMLIIGGEIRLIKREFIGRFGTHYVVPNLMEG